MAWQGWNRPGCGVETETSGAASYDGDFVFEGEDVCEIGEVDVCFCHGGDGAVWFCTGLECEGLGADRQVGFLIL